MQLRNLIKKRVLLIVNIIRLDGCILYIFSGFKIVNYVNFSHRISRTK